MPAVPFFFVEPIWEQFQALISVRFDAYPLGCHRRRIPDRIIFDKLVQVFVLVLVLVAAYATISDSSCSAAALRQTRDEWIQAGIFTRLEQICLDAYHRMIGLDLGDVAVDGCIVRPAVVKPLAVPRSIAANRAPNGQCSSTGTGSRSAPSWPARTDTIARYCGRPWRT